MEIDRQRKEREGDIDREVDWNRVRGQIQKDKDGGDRGIDRQIERDSERQRDRRKSD